MGTGLLAGYAWTAWSLWQEHKHPAFTPCIFKNVTGIACPSCGSTRAITMIARGHITESLLMNPLGLLLAAVMLTFPLWLLYDVVFKKDTLYTAFKKFETILRIKWVAITLVILILINWAWNIQKGL